MITTLAVLGITTVTLKYAPAPADNPLKGLVPYQRPVGEFPHSMEFNYIGLNKLVVGKGKYDWTKLEALLNDVAKRGNQAVFRVFLEYPGQPSAIPTYLTDGGLKVHRYSNTNTAPHPPQESITPDYEDPELRRCLKDFIFELGKRYDGDPRIGFITAGLLGTWGEWHTYPREDLWASKAVQTEVLDAYESAFKTTRILLRYPAGTNEPTKAPTINRKFGYHDDSFAWGTLDTPTSRDWYFVPALKAAGPSALATWRTQPIGGEIRPEAWGKVFDQDPGDPNIQDFRSCVETTHASWLMDSGMFRETQSAARIERAKREVQRMGYEFFAQSASWEQTGETLRLAVTVTNRGVAPFYYNWPVEFALIDADRNALASQKHTFRLVQLLPGIQTTWRTEFQLGGTSKGLLAMRIKNPLPNGKPIRFANTTQSQGTDGWLVLGTL
jgi:hypothetical protein